MAFRLYVGNYPSSFTRNDVENLFRDFDGIKVDKIFESKSKSFSFLNCKDIDQLMCVIKKMNRTSVCGRNLVVRASDYRLQEYVDLILQNDETSSSEKALSSPSESPFIPVQVMRNKCRQSHGKSGSEKSGNMHNKSDASNFPMSYEDGGVSANKSTCSSRLMHNIYQHKEYASDCASANDSNLLAKTPNEVNNQRSPRNNNESLKNNTHSSKSPLNSYQTVSNKYEHEYFETDSNHSSGSLQKSYHQATKQLNNDFSENTSPESHTYGQPKHERYNHDEIKTSNNSYSGYSYNNTIDIDSQASRNTGYFSQQSDSSIPTWISVTNFRIGTCAETLYELFSDYNPLKVKMICNIPRRDRTLCEAHICFPNKDIADDVILNFDNTMFEGRIILVNDVEDLTIMNELLNVSLS